MWVRAAAAALCCAASMGHADCVRMLLEEGDVGSAKDKLAPAAEAAPEVPEIHYMAGQIAIAPTTYRHWRHARRSYVG